MTMQDWYRHLVENIIDAEKLLLTIMGVVSGYMLWGTTQFKSESAARFPRLTASIVLIGTVLLLLRGYLPGPIKQIFVSEEAVFEASEEFTEHKEAVEHEPPENEMENVSTAGRPLHDSVFTALAIVGYAIIGYTIGLLWASPLFVVVYAWWFRVNLLPTAVLTVVSFAIAYSFMIVLNVPMDAGEFFIQGGVPWLPQ